MSGIKGWASFNTKDEGKSVAKRGIQQNEGEEFIRLKENEVEANVVYERRDRGSRTVFFTILTSDEIEMSLHFRN